MEATSLTPDQREEAAEVARMARENGSHVEVEI